MNLTPLHYQLALTQLYGIGPRKARLLIARLPSLESLFTLNIQSISEQTGIALNTLRAINREKALSLSHEHVAYIKKHDIQTYFYLDVAYPRRLNHCSDAPLLLFGSGNMALNATRYVSIVGTRNATSYGKSVCEELVSGMHDKNIVVVSGMAYGIDICVHQLCLKYGIQTIGVLGHGLDIIYPGNHRQTAERMLKNGGLLTEFFPGTKPDRENFPMRNRIVAGMSDATIVVESKEKGGSLITADLANDYNRDVFAIPGNVGQEYSIGCNLLIAKEKAHLITSCNDFLTYMSWNDVFIKPTIQTQLFAELSPDEQVLFELLHTQGEQSIDLLSMKSAFPISKTSVFLFNLEMKGVVKSLPGKKYSIC
jgi:DNA processing protein